MNKLEKIIKEFGGRESVSKKLNVTTETIRKWKYVGVSYKTKGRLLDIAYKEHMNIASKDILDL